MKNEGSRNKEQFSFIPRGIKQKSFFCHGILSFVMEYFPLIFVFSSHEIKSQVSFTDPTLSNVVCRLYVNFSLKKTTPPPILIKLGINDHLANALKKCSDKKFDLWGPLVGHLIGGKLGIFVNATPPSNKVKIQFYIQHVAM